MSYSSLPLVILPLLLHFLVVNIPLKLIKNQLKSIRLAKVVEKDMATKSMMYIHHCITIQVQHFIETQHTITLTQSKSFQEYGLNGKHTEKIRQFVYTTYKSTYSGFNTTLSSCITQEGLGWMLNVRNILHNIVNPT